MTTTAIDWSACINESAIDNMSLEKLQYFNEVLKEYGNKLICTVYDSNDVAYGVYSEFNGRGMLVCDVVDTGEYSDTACAYWEDYWDIISFVASENKGFDLGPDGIGVCVYDSDGEEIDIWSDPYDEEE